MFMCVKLNSLFYREMKNYCVTKAFKQGVYIKTVRPNYILVFRHTKSHLLKVYLGAWVKIETVIENKSVKV